MPKSSSTYCLLTDLPLEVGLAGGWRLYLTHCGEGVFCHFQELGGSAGERYLCSGETEEWVLHHLGVIGIEVEPGTLVARLFEQLVSEGRAERLPHPRHWRDHPYPQSEKILHPVGYCEWSSRHPWRVVG